MSSMIEWKPVPVGVSRVYDDTIARGASCQRRDWPNHRSKCGSAREMHERAKSTAASSGGGKGFRRSRDEAIKWFMSVPGLDLKVMSSAWRHRDASSVVYVYTAPTDLPLCMPQVRVIPRTAWDVGEGSPLGPSPGVREDLRILTSRNDPDNFFVICFYLNHSGAHTLPGGPANLTTIAYYEHMAEAVAILDALALATSGEDLAAGIARFEASHLPRIHFSRWGRRCKLNSVFGLTTPKHPSLVLTTFS